MAMNESTGVVDHNHPLYLQASDAPGSLNVGIQLSGMENYTLWNRAMRVALLGKNKIDFVDGTIKKSTYGDVLGDQWERCNAIVLSWLMCNVSKNLLSGILFKSNAHLVWKDLQERFDKVNETRTYQLHKEIATMTHGVSSISVYFSKLKDLWDEYESIIPPPSCDCEKSREFATHLEKQKVYQFLMGLNDSCSQARSQILMMLPLPTLNQAYVMLVQDEDQKHIAGESHIDPTALFTASKGGRKNSYNLKCDHCNKRGHTRETCFQLVECDVCGQKGHLTENCFKSKKYGQDYKRKSSQDYRSKKRANAVQYEDDTPLGAQTSTYTGTPYAAGPALTQSQYDQIVAMLSRSTLNDASANMAGPLQWEGQGDW